MSSSPLPPLYDRWVTSMTGEELAGEPRSSCLDCAMLTGGSGVFHPDTKCCTFTPALPNYLVGAALADERLDPVGGRQSLRARIARRIGVTPLLVDRDPLSDLLGSKDRTFGRTPKLVCPHYHSESGKCGIWLHRNAVCSTWFCKHDRGAVGQSFWMATRDLLLAVERELSRWCVLELGAPYSPPREAQVDQMTAEDLEGTVDDAAYRRQWGDWFGRELELYARAHEMVSALSWDDVIRICGPEVGLQARAFEEARLRRDQSFVPASLVLRRLTIDRHGDPTVLGAYSSTDPIAVPRLLVDLLPTFQGQPTADALAEIARDAEVDLEDELLVRLVDFGILADADEPPVT